MLHGYGNCDTEQCRTPQSQAKKMKAACNAQMPEGKAKWKKNQELNAVAEVAVKSYLNKKKCKMEDKVEELNAFSQLSISDSDLDSDSE